MLLLQTTELSKQFKNSSESILEFCDCCLMFFCPRMTNRENAPPDALPKNSMLLVLLNSHFEKKW